jgi:GNAT superfamily N-acetyltransferase
MSVSLVPVAPEQFPSWRERSCAEYEADLIALGETPQEARQHAIDSMERAFPANVSTVSNAVFDLVDDTGEAVGYLWVGRDASSDITSWWVWDVVVDPAHRGKGLGRTAMQLAEDYARSQGALTLGLSVFGFNRVARGLYESLGYETTSVKMRKRL